MGIIVNKELETSTGRLFLFLAYIGERFKAAMKNGKSI
jgi:hypothetical protein